jgi:hypothetical protein
MSQQRTMFIKILLAASLVVAGMLVVKDGRVFARAGLTASCSEVSARGHDNLIQGCKRGRLEGYPDLSKRSCVSIGTKKSIEYWRCPARVVSSQAPRP